LDAGVTMANASLSGGDVMGKKTVTLVRMKRTAQRNVHARADQMNFHVPLATAYWYGTLLIYIYIYICVCVCACIYIYILYIYRKGKAIPLQACTGSEGSRRLRLPDFKTTGNGRW
jgi:hypothetical protein